MQQNAATIASYQLDARGYALSTEHASTPKCSVVHTFAECYCKEQLASKENKIINSDVSFTLLLCF
jgi:hypothetical protein